MAVTDDIAEKVSSILFETLLRGANYSIEKIPELAGDAKNAVQKANKGVSNLAKKLVDSMDRSQLTAKSGQVTDGYLNNVARRLSARAHSVRIADSDTRDFEAMLDAEKVLYAKLDMRDDNCAMYTYLDRDYEKVQIISHTLEASRNYISEINPNLFVESLHPEKVMTVNGLDDVELELFRHYARKHDVLFTTVPSGSKHMLIYPKEEAVRAREALLNVGWDLTGAQGAIIRQQVQHRLKGRSAINISAEEGSRELYIVSRRDPGHFVHITSEDYRLYKQNKQVATVSRESSTFHSRCIADCDGLRDAAVLTPEEFEQMTEESLTTKPNIELFPRGLDENVEQNIQNRIKDLISRKISLDDEGNADWGIEDPSISYSDFAAMEFIADDEERDSRDAEFEHFKDAMFFAQRQYEFEEVVRNGKNLDYIISRAEAKKRAVLGEEVQRDRTLGKDDSGAPSKEGSAAKPGRDGDFEVL